MDADPWLNPHAWPQSAPNSSWADRKAASRAAPKTGPCNGCRPMPAVPPCCWPRPSPGDWTGPLRALVVGLIAGLAGALAWLLFRLWQTHRRRLSAAVAAESATPAPDLGADHVAPEQLPEDGWLRLARDLLERGERRLALRALYLSSLAHLGARGLIALARFKSNLDYERELARRAHALPELVAVFRQNVGVFDRVWYGLHEVSAELLERFAGNVERIKAQ